MGYTTRFTGKFDLSRQLTLDEFNLLAGLKDDPPDNAPNSYCQWEPTKDGRHIEWDHGEKFYYYKEWLEFIQKTYLTKWRINLSGRVEYQGEEIGDSGYIEVNEFGEINQVNFEQMLKNTGDLKEIIKLWLNTYAKSIEYDYSEAIEQLRDLVK